jgi:protein-disulfide isomerase
MKRAALLAAVAAAAAAIAAPAAVSGQAKKAAPRAAAAPVDWSKRVAATPEGGFVMGNPAARVKVIEYASLTCPHCADFAAAAKAPLAARVKTGRVSFEYRSFVLNGMDLTATLVARCAGPAGFFPLADRLFATQSQWVGRISGMPQAQKDQLKALPDGQRLGRLAEIGGITQIAAQAGVTPQRANACLADTAALERLGTVYEAASALGVEGTPTFFINGKMVHAHDWRELDALIVKAGG